MISSIEIRLTRWLIACVLFAFVPTLLAAESQLADAAEKSDRVTISTLLKQHADVDTLERELNKLGDAFFGLTPEKWEA